MKGFYRMFLKIFPSLFALAVISAFLIQRVDGSEGLPAQEGSLLKEAWQQSGAELDRICVSGWASLGEEFLTVGELSSLVKKAAHSFGFSPGENLTVMDHLSFRMAGFNETLKNGASLQLSAQSVTLEISGKEKNETYLVAEVWDRTWSNLEEYENKISALLETGKGAQNLITTFTGRIKGPLSETQRQEIIKKVFGNLRAEKVEEMQDGTLSSVSGYTSLLKREITSGSKHVNVQMAFTYDEMEDETVVILASPVIMMEY